MRLLKNSLYSSQISVCLHVINLLSRNSSIAHITRDFCQVSLDIVTGSKHNAPLIILYSRGHLCLSLLSPLTTNVWHCVLKQSRSFVYRSFLRGFIWAKTSNPRFMIAVKGHNSDTIKNTKYICHYLCSASNIKFPLSSPCVCAVRQTQS